MKPILVRPTGLEPVRSRIRPQTYVSANSTTAAYMFDEQHDLLYILKSALSIQKQQKDSRIAHPHLTLI